MWTLKRILKSNIVKPHFPMSYHLETMQYFRDARRHFDNMQRYHKLTESPEDLPLRRFDYTKKRVWENQSFKGAYFRALSQNHEELVFINCAFADCDFEVGRNLTIIFDQCKFDLERQGGFGNTHNRFNGDGGVYRFKHIRHAMLLCQRPPAKEAAFEMYFEHCSDFSVYLVDYARVHLYLHTCEMRRLFVKDAHCLVTHSDSTLQSYLMLPPRDPALKNKCTKLYQSINSVLFNGLLSQHHDDYYPLHLIRQLAKRHSYREELETYRYHLSAGVLKEVLNEPKPNYSLIVMQLFDFFAYPLSLSVRSLGIIMIYAIIFSFIGVYDAVVVEVIRPSDLSTFGEWMGYLSKALYMSVTSFTTAGYGDYVLPPGWELVSATETLIGVLYSGALITSIFNRFHHG